MLSAISSRRHAANDLSRGMGVLSVGIGRQHTHFTDNIFRVGLNYQFH
jgi:hypothetical protein